ncbi:putative Myb/SANT-like domain-containing protein [Senna tora]|uniref:Putative Myb/SANT-like domain-containing protein n=1 Tax=Senna tora TaxID=362788 RepID=A0A834SZW4_9FABA|nr:putative Myb/SANT-like domain-containing protein [Senna tora]
MDPEADNVDNRSSKHNRSAEEDAALVACLVSMKEDQNHMLGSKFTSGHLGELEKMMQNKLPCCGLKGNPYIQSRIKTLKSNWTTVHDMVYDTKYQWLRLGRGPTDGGGRERCLGCVHKVPFGCFSVQVQAISSLNRPDESMGERQSNEGDAQDPKEINDQADEDVIGLEGQNQTPPADGDQPTSDEMIQPKCEAASTSRKRKRTSPSNDVIDCFKEITEPFLHRLDKITDGMNRFAREKALDEKREALCQALSQVDGLTDDELIRVHLRLAIDPALMVCLFGLEDRLKLRWLQQIIG